MARPLSNDLRERVAAAVLSGESRRSAAERFDIAVSTVVKLSQGSAALGKMGGYRKGVLEPHRAFIEARIRETPHLTLHRLKDELADRGVKVSYNPVWLFLRHEGLSFKKTLLGPFEQKRADIARRRQRWGSWQAGLDPQCLAFIDETGSRPTWLRCEVGGPKGTQLRGLV